MEPRLRARLEEIIEKKKSGVALTRQDTEDFARLQRLMRTKDYPSYCKAIRPKYKWAWFHQYIQDKINDAFARKKGRLICKMHQQSGKSELFGRCAVSYAFGTFPEWKILYLTYSDERARELSADILGFITSEEYQELFPHVILKDNLREEFRTADKRRQKLSINNFTNANSKRGEFKAAGIEGSYNGYDANLIILDDFFSGYAEANSATVRESRWQAFLNNILTRQQRETIILVMSTQWHADDIIGRLEEYINTKSEDSPDWEVIQFNACKDEREYAYDHREIGEYLWPEQRLDAYLEMQQLNPIGWQTTYQNIPPTSTGVIFDSSCFRFYDEMPHIGNMHIIISVDPNYKKNSKEGDEAAIVVFGIQGIHVYLLEFNSIAKVDILENVARIKEHVAKYPRYYSILVELKGQGEDIVTLLQDEGLSKVESFEPGQGKLYRAQCMLPFCKAGQFHIPSPLLKDKNGQLLCPDIQKYINQFMRFTGFKGGKDDLVDATTQVFMYFDYLLKPLELKRRDYHIKNNFGVGNGLTKLTNPLARLGHVKTQAKLFH